MNDSGVLLRPGPTSRLIRERRLVPAATGVPRAFAPDVFGGGAPSLEAARAGDGDFPAAGDHPLAEQALGQLLRLRAERITAAFDAIEPLLRDLASAQFMPGFADLARARLSERLGLELPSELFASSWTAALDMRRLYAHCVMATFCRLVDQDFRRKLALAHEEESLDVLIHRWGFHAVDIAVCADGRLSGVLDYILRIPAGVVTHRRSHAGAMFDLEASLRHWEAVELRRWRDAWPNRASDPTRFLKIGVYHFSGADPEHSGCAAHGSNTRLAADRLLTRLEQFADLVGHQHGSRPAVLLIGVDTDNDAIRVHVPDRKGRMEVGRFVDNAVLFASTRAMARDPAKEAIRAAVADCAGVAQDDGSTTGMRWLCAYLLKNNLGQHGAVRALAGGRYPDGGHTERLIIVGDAIDGVQLRNLAFQAQMETVEEGALDLDVGVAILREFHQPQGLAVPILIHCAHRVDVPAAAERAQARAQRLQAAVTTRYEDLVAIGAVQVHAVTLPSAEGEFKAHPAAPQHHHQDRVLA